MRFKVAFEIVSSEREFHCLGAATAIIPCYQESFLLFLSLCRAEVDLKIFNGSDFQARQTVYSDKELKLIKMSKLFHYHFQYISENAPLNLTILKYLWRANCHLNLMSFLQKLSFTSLFSTSVLSHTDSILYQARTLRSHPRQKKLIN